MLPDEVHQLLEPGCQSIETGYFRLPNGYMHVRALTRMPRCKGAMVDWWFGWMETADHFDTSTFAEARVGAVICGNAQRPDGTPDGRVIHFIQDTDFGCEMRSRFWLYDAPDVAGPGVMAHCLTEMGTMADFLPDLYGKETSQAA